MTIESPSWRFVFDFLKPFVYQCPLGGDWKSISIKENTWVSQTTKAFVRRILAARQCELPTLEQSYPAHQYILETLQPHFDELLKQQHGFCPVT